MKKKIHLQKKNMINEVLKVYFEYLSLNSRDRLKMGEKLTEASKMLLEYTPPFGDDYFHRFFVMKRLASDMLQYSIDIEYAREYESKEQLFEYFKAAFNLAFEFYGHNPDRELLPYLRYLLTFEPENEEYKALFRKCLKLEKSFYSYLKNSNS